MTVNKHFAFPGWCRCAHTISTEEVESVKREYEHRIDQTGSAHTAELQKLHKQILEAQQQRQVSFKTCNSIY